MNVLILDDDPQRHKVFAEIFDEWNKTHVFTASAAIGALDKQGRFDLVCLDHDLGDFNSNPMVKDPGDGMEVAEFIGLHMGRDKHPAQVLIHSWNEPARERMAQALKEGNVPYVVAPFKAGWRTIKDIGR